MRRVAHIKLFPEKNARAVQSAGWNCENANREIGVPGAVLSGCGNRAAVEQKHHAQKQHQGWREQRKNSIVERALTGLAQCGGGGVAKGAALREDSLRER